MLADNEIVKVTNRDNGSVGYTIPDLGNLHRNFYPAETKKDSSRRTPQVKLYCGRRLYS